MTNSRPWRRTRPPRSEENECDPRYRQAKATKRGGMDGRKSQRCDSTVEAGELAPEDPVKGSAASAGRPDRGKQVEHIEVPVPVHVTRSDSLGDRLRRANLSVEEPDALMHARPGLWEPWGVIPRATRPEASNENGPPPYKVGPCSATDRIVPILSRPCSFGRDLPEIDDEGPWNPHLDNKAGQTDPLPVAIQDARVSRRGNHIARTQDGIRIGNDLS